MIRRARSSPRSEASHSFIRTSSTDSSKPPLSRDNVRVLMSIDIEKTDLNQGRGCARPCVRPDADYALSWIHTYGKGRVFFTALGHTPAFFAAAESQRLLLQGHPVRARRSRGRHDAEREAG